MTLRDITWHETLTVGAHLFHQLAWMAVAAPETQFPMGVRAIVGDRCRRRGIDEGEWAVRINVEQPGDPEPVARFWWYRGALSPRVTNRLEIGA